MIMKDFIKHLKFLFVRRFELSNEKIFISFKQNTNETFKFFNSSSKKKELELLKV